MGRVEMTQEMLKDFDKFREAVMDYMEYIGVPEYVESFEPEDVAKTFYNSMVDGYMWGISTRMCALVIFSCTLEKINSQFVKN